MLLKVITSNELVIVDRAPNLLVAFSLGSRYVHPCERSNAFQGRIAGAWQGLKLMRFAARLHALIEMLLPFRADCDERRLEHSSAMKVRTFPLVRDPISPTKVTERDLG